MKKKKSEKQEFTWGCLTFGDPYIVIKEIFSFAHVDFYRDFIGDILLYSSRKKVYRKKYTGDIMFILDGIFCLLQAGYVISKERKHSILDIRESDILNSSFYTLTSSGIRQWADFPRSLSKDEMLDPYSALGRLFKHYKPDKLYNAIKRLATDACGCYENELEENTLEIYVSLSKLFEAAHLIWVRELEHIRNWRLDKLS